MKNDLVLAHASSSRGADMGRPDNIPDCVRKMERVKLYLVKLEWVDGDYDQGGAYWGGGIGDNVYCAWGTAFNPANGGNAFPPIQVFVRGCSRYAAKVQVQDKLANVRFYR